MTYDKIILGAGLYGLYAAQKCGAAGQRVLVLERDPAPFMRATYINQARVHMGYHYPRSYSTAIKSAHYFERFCRDYGFCLHTEFDQVYATSAHFSWTNAAEFRQFCRAAGINMMKLLTEDVVYGRRGKCIYNETTALWSNVPRGILTRYVTSPALREEMKQYKALHTLWCGGDLAPARVYRLARYYAAQYKNFARYYFDKSKEK